MEDIFTGMTFRKNLDNGMKLYMEVADKKIDMVYNEYNYYYTIY